jgi:hypothetical protein
MSPEAFYLAQEDTLEGLSSGNEFRTFMRIQRRLVAM